MTSVLETPVERESRAETTSPPRFHIGLATRGRPETLVRVVEHLRRQTLRPDGMTVACVDPSDVAGLARARDIEVVFCEPGLTRQRNAVLDRAPPQTDYVVFFDDDFLPDARWLEACAEIFAANPQVSAVTGNVLADGILGPGLTFEEGEAALREATRRRENWIVENFSPYGCNMAFRMSALAGLRFDERLPLYGWLEDRDFGARLANRGGKLVKIGAAAGVHLGVKRGRLAGVRLGYSQIANPVYLWRKGAMSSRDALIQMARNLAANLARSARPEPFVDRRGRVRGNVLALFDLVKGACRPERVETL